MPKKITTELAHYKDLANWRKSNLNRPWYKFALKLLPSKKGEIVLDMGAGAGEFAQILKKSGKLVHCCDFSRIYIEKLKKKGFPSKMADFNCQLPYKSKVFGGIICLEVIEHIAKAEVFLKEINRILKKDGWLILSTPNISWFGYRILALLGRVPFKEGYHLRYFNYYQLKKNWPIQVLK